MSEASSRGRVPRGAGSYGVGGRAGPLEVARPPTAASRLRRSFSQWATAGGLRNRIREKHWPAAVTPGVANQQPNALQQQRGVSRQPRAGRLAHHPGDAAVRARGARQLSGWPSGHAVVASPHCSDFVRSGSDNAPDHVILGACFVGRPTVSPRCVRANWDRCFRTRKRRSR